MITFLNNDTVDASISFFEPVDLGPPALGVDDVGKAVMIGVHEIGT